MIRMAIVEDEAKYADHLGLNPSEPAACFPSASTLANAWDPEKHHAFACRAAGESSVLLKNEDAFLPLTPGTRTAVIGDFAAAPRYQGAGSSAVNPTWLDNALTALKDSGLEITGYAPGFLRHGGNDPDKLARAVELANVAVVFAGGAPLAGTVQSDGQRLSGRPGWGGRPSGCLANDDPVALGAAPAGPALCRLPAPDAFPKTVDSAHQYLVVMTNFTADLNLFLKLWAR